jgi:hypothetical protein
MPASCLNMPAGLSAKVRFNALPGMLPIIAMFALQAPAGAASLESTAMAQIGPFPNPICIQTDQNFDGLQPSKAQCLGRAAGTTFNALAFGNAAFGRLGVLVSVDLNNLTVGNGFPGLDVEGFASFSDVLTFSAGSTALFPFIVTGSGGGLLGKIGDTLQVVNVPPAEVVTLSYQIAPGVPVAIGFAFETGLRNVGCPFPLVTCDFHFLADLSDTAALQRVQVLDSRGNPLTGVTITSESGFDYSGGVQSSVPEPGTLLFTGLGCALLFLIAKHTCIR